MSIRKLLAESRRSGPAYVYEPDENGELVHVRTRPARDVSRGHHLSREESLFLLTVTGEWPEPLPAEANCGVQATDVGYSMFELRDRLRTTGIMSGVFAGAESRDPE
jgi:hypothetical protein